jgi:hypothetical protein
VPVSGGEPLRGIAYLYEQTVEDGDNPESGVRSADAIASALQYLSMGVLRGVDVRADQARREDVGAWVFVVRMVLWGAGPVGDEHDLVALDNDSRVDGRNRNQTTGRTVHIVCSGRSEETASALFRR